MKRAGLKLDFDKCSFTIKEVKYLGFIVEAGVGIKVDPEKVAAISEWEALQNVTAVRLFLGFTNFYRKFVPIFTEIASPLNKLTRRGAPWVWGDREQTSFNRLKEIIICAPVLSMLDETRETILEADSSGFAMGGVVSQVGPDNILRPIGFFS